MKFIVKLLIIAIASFFGLQFFPWWLIAIIPFIVNMILKTKGAGAFFSSFLGVALAWFIASYNFYSQGTAFVGKMAKVFYLVENGLLLIVVASAIMGLVGALSGYSGNAFRNIIIKPKDKSKSKYGRPDYSRYSR